MSQTTAERIVASFSRYPPLVHRRLDMVLAVAMGFAAYALYERRTGRPEGHTLYALVREKYFN